MAQAQSDDRVKRREGPMVVLLLLLLLLQGTSTLAGFAQTAGSRTKSDLVEQTEDKSGKAKVKDEGKKATASNAA